MAETQQRQKCRNDDVYLSSDDEVWIGDPKNLNSLRIKRSKKDCFTKEVIRMNFSKFLMKVYNTYDHFMSIWEIFWREIVDNGEKELTEYIMEINSIMELWKDSVCKNSEKHVQKYIAFDILVWLQNNISLTNVEDLENMSKEQFEKLIEYWEDAKKTYLSLQATKTTFMLSTTALGVTELADV